MRTIIKESVTEEDAIKNVLNFYKELKDKNLIEALIALIKKQDSQIK